MKNRPNRIKDISGVKRGALTVVKYLYTRDKKTYWKCVCACGNLVTRTKSNLLYSPKKRASCGCLQKISANRKHNLSSTRFYKIWTNIQTRIYNKKATAYEYWGGRGITCSWRSFEEFRKDMYESYISHVNIYGEKMTQIDRTDNNGGYSKDNCRWVTPSENALNRRPRKKKSKLT